GSPLAKQLPELRDLSIGQLKRRGQHDPSDSFSAGGSRKRTRIHVELDSVRIPVVVRGYREQPRNHRWTRRTADIEPRRVRKLSRRDTHPPRCVLQNLVEGRVRLSASPVNQNGKH